MAYGKTLVSLVLVAALGCALPASAKFKGGAIADSNLISQKYYQAYLSEVIAGLSKEQNYITSQLHNPEIEKSTSTLDNLEVMAELEGEVELYRQLQSANSQMIQNVFQIMNLVQNIRSQWGASNLSFEAFCSQLASSSNQRDQILVKSFKASAVEMQQVAQRRQEILNQLGGAVGQTEAFQAVGAAIDTIIGQNQQVLNLMAIQAADQVAEKNDEQARAEHAARVMQDYQNRMKNAAERFK